MTDKQYERFRGIIKAINSISESKKDIFDKQNLLITITDKNNLSIRIKVKQDKGQGKCDLNEYEVNPPYTNQEFYIKDMMISKLKLLEKKNKKLDFDNQCNLNIAIKLKPKFKKRRFYGKAKARKSEKNNRNNFNKKKNNNYRRA